jgi:hypothetical protein
MPQWPSWFGQFCPRTRRIGSRDGRWQADPVAQGGDAQPVAVRVFEGALAPSEPFFIDANRELLRHGIYVVDIEVDQGVRPSVAVVLRQVKPGMPTCYGDEGGKARLELMLPLFDEPEPPIPCDSPCCVAKAR